jgi:hypothetical protein
MVLLPTRVQAGAGATSKETEDHCSREEGSREEGGGEESSGKESGSKGNTTPKAKKVMKRGKLHQRMRPDDNDDDHNTEGEGKVLCLFHFCISPYLSLHFNHYSPYLTFCNWGFCLAHSWCMVRTLMTFTLNRAEQPAHASNHAVADSTLYSVKRGNTPSQY